VTTWIVLEAIINIASVVGGWAVTGIPLPFFSYGGTALITELAAVGLMYNVAHDTSHRVTWRSANPASSHCASPTRLAARVPTRDELPPDRVRTLVGPIVITAWYGRPYLSDAGD